MNNDQKRIRAAAKAYKEGTTAEGITELVVRIETLESAIESLSIEFEIFRLENDKKIHALRNTINMMKRNRKILGG